MAQPAFVDVRVDAGKQLAGDHPVPFLDRELDDLTTDFGGDLDFHLGLDSARSDDRFHDSVTADRFNVAPGQFRSAS